MTTSDAPGPRIDAAKAAAHALVAGLVDDTRLGLVTYGTKTGSSDAEQAAGCQDVTVLVPLATLNRQELDAQVDGLRPSGYTPISLALKTATDLLPTDGRKQAIVLVSDGEDTCGTPPCDVAKQLHQQHPGLAISTVGFRTAGPASEQLECIASSTGGLFVEAANAAQLAARLRATQDVQAAQASLTSTGLAGVDVGANIADIRRAHQDFPDNVSSGRVVVVWHDCEFAFVDGVLDSIAPRDGGHTIDGVTAGSPIGDAVGFYGAPQGAPELQNGVSWLLFAADAAAGTGYRIGVDGYTGTTTGTYTGTVKRIILCGCLPRPADGPPTASFDGFGAVKLGMTKAEATAVLGNSVEENHYYTCTVLSRADGPYKGISAWIQDATGRVTGIDTGPGAKTDRGVGEGSTPEQIQAAYPSPFAVENGMGGQGIPAVNVRNGSGGLLSFSLDGDTVYPPSIGRLAGWEGCDP
jgi:Ca-activated chloride channel family protein